MAYDNHPNASNSTSLSPLDASVPLGGVSDNGDGTFTHAKRCFYHLFIRETAVDALSYAILSNHGRSSAARVTITIPDIDGYDNAGDSNPTGSMLSTGPGERADDANNSLSDSPLWRLFFS